MDETDAAPRSDPPGEAEGESFALSAEPAGGRAQRARYKYPLPHYEGIFGTKVRAMKRWIAIGRDANPPDLPPLDQPEKVAAWWRRRMAHRVPEKLLDLERAGRAAAPAAAPRVANQPAGSDGVTAGAAKGQQTAGVAAPIAFSYSVGEGAGAATDAKRGFAGTLQRLRDAEAQTGTVYNQLMQRAAAEMDPGEQMRLTAAAEQTRRTWETLTKELRQYEADAPKVLAASGDAWFRPDVLAANLEIHTVIAAGVRGLVRRVRPKLQGLNPSDQDALWDSEVDRLFAVFRANKFTAPPADDPAA